jgi:hypothetical protein
MKNTNLFKESGADFSKRTVRLASHAGDGVQVRPPEVRAEGGAGAAARRNGRGQGGGLQGRRGRGQGRWWGQARESRAVLEVRALLQRQLRLPHGVQPLPRTEAVGRGGGAGLPVPSGVLTSESHKAGIS